MLFFWLNYQDYDGVAEFGRPLPVGPLTNMTAIAIGAVPALTVLTLVMFPDGSPSWWNWVRGVGFIIASQSTIAWVRRLITNLRLRQRRPIFGKNMAFFGWLLPPFIPIFPALQFSELARKSTAPGRSSAGSQLLVFIWFVTALAWSATQIVAFQYWVDAIDALPADAPTPFNTTPREWVIYGAVAQVFGALAYIAMTRAIYAEHKVFLDATEPPAEAAEAQVQAWRANRAYAVPPANMPYQYPPQAAPPQMPPVGPPPMPPTGPPPGSPPHRYN